MFDFRNWRLKYRLMSLIGLIGLCMVSLCGVAGWQIYNSLFDAKRAELQHLAETALSLVEKQHRQMVEGKLSEPEAKAKALEAIAELRYDGSNYFWINDMTPAMVMHPKVMTGFVTQVDTQHKSQHQTDLRPDP